MMDGTSLGEQPEREGHLYEFGTVELVFWFAMYGIVAVLAVVGNTFVILIVARRRRMQTVTNLYIVNLAVADVVEGLLVVPFKFQAALLQQWLLPAFMCNLIPFIDTVSPTASVFVMTVTTIDRLRMFFNPSAAMTVRTAKRIIAGIWLTSIALSIPYGIGHSLSMDFMPNVTVCYAIYGDETWWKTYNIYLTIIQYYVPLPIINGIYCYIGYKVFRAKPISRNEEQGGDAGGTGGEEAAARPETPALLKVQGQLGQFKDSAFQHDKKKVMNLLMIVIIAFTFCWFPYETYLVLAEVRSDINDFYYINIIFFAFHWLAMSNSCINPFIYWFYNQKFQREYRRMFRNILRLGSVKSQHSVAFVRNSYRTLSSQWRSIARVSLPQLQVVREEPQTAATSASAPLANGAAVTSAPLPEISVTYAGGDELADLPTDFKGLRQLDPHLARRFSCLYYIAAELGRDDMDFAEEEKVSVSNARRKSSFV